ncbi:MAG: hypothetical protein JO199_06740, partial [Candidatus Eremiobacteraeota bacterium]|nr:hypothetical protein [Candidatus Eremiobacteraeota bacterium]
MSSQNVSHSGGMQANNARAHDRHDQCWFCVPRIVTPLSFDGTNFTVPQNQKCWDVFDAPVYKAPSSGALALNGPVTLPVTCAQNAGSSGYGYGGKMKHTSNRPADGHGGNWDWPTPSPANYSLYIVAIQIPTWNGWGHDDVRKHLRERPRDFQDDDLVQIVAGPGAINGNPWTLPQWYPQANLQAKGQYVFFLVALCSNDVPSPGPSP